MDKKTTVLGKVCLTPRGEYNAQTEYEALDVISWQGSSWLVVDDFCGITPGTGNPNTILLAQKGEKGDTLTFDDLTDEQKAQLKGDTGEGFKVMGYYESLLELEAMVDNPKPGDAYGIGESAPYDIYIYDPITETWINNGQVQGPTGPEGKTAYQAYQEAGGNLSEEEFNQSLATIPEKVDLTSTQTITGKKDFTTPPTINGEEVALQTSFNEEICVNTGYNSTAYQNNVILLHPDVLEGTTDYIHAVIGALSFHRTVGSVSTKVEITSSIGYSAGWRSGNLIIMKGGNDGQWVNIKMVTCQYEGITYRALHIGGQQNISFVNFRGYVYKKDRNFLKFIHYHTSDTSEVVNEEIYNSLQDWVSLGNNTVDFPYGLEVNGDPVVTEKAEQTITGKKIFTNTMSVFPSHFYHRLYSQDMPTVYTHYYTSEDSGKVDSKCVLRVSTTDTNSSTPYKEFVFDGQGNLTWVNKKIYHEGNLDTNQFVTKRNNATLLGNFCNTSSESREGFKIKLPVKKDSLKMLIFTVRLYTNYEPMDVQFSGYLYSQINQWYQPKAFMICGDNPVKVAMGYDENDYAYVWLSSTVGNLYGGCSILDVVNAYFNQDWNEGWEITRTNETPNVALEKTVYPPLNPLELRTLNTLTGMPVNKFNMVRTYTTATPEPISFTTTPPEGYECVLYIKNETDETITQPIPTTNGWQSEEESIEIPAGKIIEIRIKYILGTYIVRR